LAQAIAAQLKLHANCVGAMSHAWERDLDSGEVEADAHWYESSSDDSDGECTAAEAAARLLDFVLNMHQTGALSAKTACVIFWWAGKAGLDSVRRWGFRPDAPSGHFQRHLDSMLGAMAARKDRYQIQIPSYQKHHRGRVSRRTPVQIPHEALDLEARSDPLFIDTLTRAIDEHELPPLYNTCAGDGPLASPVAIYVDGAQFLNRDSMIGFWVYNILSGARSVCVTLRRSWFCRCGCRGWCTVWAALDFLRWSFEHARRGEYPNVGYHDEAFTGARGIAAGTAMAVRFVLQYIKGDWSEFAHTFGLPNWKTSLSPCAWCLTTTAEWLTLDDISDRVDALSPWPTFTSDDYEDACSVCEINVVIGGREAHNICIANLHYDKRKDGSRGRALKNEIPALALEKGDRLEPSSSLPDVAMFEAKRSYPFTVTFWRRSRETACRHRNPLLLVPGVGPELLVIDVLHCICLGIAQSYLAAVIWLLITSNVWKIHASTTIDSFEENAVLRLHHDIMDFYATRRPIKHRVEGTTELQDLTMSMLGKRDDKIFKAKGAETKSLIPFAIMMLERHGTACRPDAAPHLLVAGKALMEVIRIQAAYNAVLPWEGASSMYKWGVQHVRAAFLGGVHPQPKHHAFVHLLRDAFTKGNPKAYACWEDEGLNKVIAGVASAAYPTVWEHRIIEHMNLLRARAARSAG